MNLDNKIKRKIKKYDPSGALGHTANVFLALSSIRHEKVKKHSQKAALLAEEVAICMKMDAKAAFFAMLLHDMGKILLPPELFDGREITAEEYKKIKEHAIMGFMAFKDLHMLISLCAGFHHAMYDRGYGLTMEDFPKGLSLKTVKKILEIATIVSICDFIEAFKTRPTKIKDGSDKNSKNLKTMLKEKYPNDHIIVETALKAWDELSLC